MAHAPRALRGIKNMQKHHVKRSLLIKSRERSAFLSHRPLEPQTFGNIATLKYSARFSSQPSRGLRIKEEAVVIWSLGT